MTETKRRTLVKTVTRRLIGIVWTWIGAYLILLLTPERYRTGAMSTIVTGESEAVFGGLRAAFDAVAGGHPVVLLVKASNACPEGEAGQADATAKARE